MSAEEKLDEIRQEVKVCQACKLSQERKNSVPGEGPAHAEVMFIGEGPGFHENEQGKPFVGQAGNFLDQLLEAAGLKRSEVFITNVVKCRPPKNRDPEPEELSLCRRYLDRQIEIIDPKIIVTLGRFSMARFVENGRIGAIHGQTHPVDGRTVITMYHPAAALHQPGLKSTLLADFAGIQRVLGKMGRTPQEPKAQNAEPTQEKEEDKSTPEQLSLF